MTAAQKQTNIDLHLCWAQGSNFPDFRIFCDQTLLGLPDTENGKSTLFRNMVQLSTLQ